MDRSLLSLLCVSLSLLGYHASSCSPGKTYTLMPNVLVVCVNTSAATPHTEVRLDCGEASGNEGAVWWKEDGHRLDGARGRRIDVSVEEEIGGNYSCHGAHATTYLNHTLLLVEEVNRRVILDKNGVADSDADGYIRCSANSYRGAFQCSWKRTGTRKNADVILFGAKRGQKELTCTVHGDGSGVSCEEPGRPCVYTEDTESIHLHLHVRSHFKLEHYSRTFYLREIVRPDPVPVTAAEGGVFQWRYPPTWSQPCSFFPLEFQVKVVPDNESCDSTNEILPIQTAKTDIRYTVKSSQKPYGFCVRARDNLTNGPWSAWTQQLTK